MAIESVHQIQPTTEGRHQYRFPIRQQARLRGQQASLPAGPSGNGNMFSSDRSESRQIWRFRDAGSSLCMSVGRRHDAVESRDDLATVGRANRRPDPVHRPMQERTGSPVGVISTRPPVRMLLESRGVPHLEGGQYVAVRQSQERNADGSNPPRRQTGGRFSGAADRSGRRQNSARCRSRWRIARPSTGHFVLCVMGSIATTRHGEGRDQPPVAPVALGDVENGQEIRLRLVRGSGAEMQVLTLGICGLGGAGRYRASAISAAAASFNG